MANSEFTFGGHHLIAHGDEQTVKATMRAFERFAYVLANMSMSEIAFALRPWVEKAAKDIDKELEEERR